MFFMSFMFMLPMFILSCMFAFELAGLVAGLGDAVTIVFELALLFELSAVVQAAAKTAKANKVRKPVVRRISVPPGFNTDLKMRGASKGWATHLSIVRISSQP